MIRYNDQTLKQFMLLHDAKAYNEPFLNIQVKHFSSTITEFDNEQVFHSNVSQP